MDMYRSTQKRLLPVFLEEALYVYALLTKREVKMAGYWPTIEYAKKNEANINPSWVTEQVWLIKNLLSGQKNNNYCSRDPTWEILILSGHDGSILPAWVVNQNPNSLHLARSDGSSHIIIWDVSLPRT